MNTDKIKFLILAAGKGTRMDSDLPKVLAPLGGKPMIKHVIESISKISTEKPISIVGHKKELVEQELGDSSLYAFQKEISGTASAVASAKEYCIDAEEVVVLSGDQPFVKSETIKNCIERHQSSKAKITFTTTEIPDFLDWRKAFLVYGRILRENDEVTGIREYKDANEEEREVKEVNTGCCYVFDSKWLWENLPKIKNNNLKNEYYLTDLFHIAREENQKIETIKMEPHEALGANSKEDLDILENFIK
jgi:bifunctional UDP-N-acetylglucosamine pyrophosphorylase/glucosamine-1-phosphate N-acetyltransferase